MQKITIGDTKQDYDPRKQAGIYIANDGILVMSCGKEGPNPKYFEGTTINSTEMHELGHHSNIWNSDAFRPFSGTINVEFT